MKPIAQTYFSAYATKGEKKKIFGAIYWSPDQKYGKIEALTDDGSRCSGEILRPVPRNHKNYEWRHISDGYLKISDNNVMSVGLDPVNGFHTVSLQPDDSFRIKKPQSGYACNYFGIAEGKILYADGTVK